MFQKMGLLIICDAGLKPFRVRSMYHVGGSLDLRNTVSISSDSGQRSCEFVTDTEKSTWKSQSLQIQVIVSLVVFNRFTIFQNIHDSS